ncbi:hypothetical protein GCM10010492_65350 [Saccharothrix mutabilis subsp. mutabilis]|uniref:DUF4367 domain-containing protein n=1 Tax=Saccharothrix mutabilis subsp. mutabilis TaxID=66855 RepID=A0ABN0UMH1_9PSEU
MTRPDVLRERLQAAPPELTAPPDLADTVLAAVRRRRTAGRIGVTALAVVAVGVSTSYLVRLDAPTTRAAGPGEVVTTTAPTVVGKLVSGPRPAPSVFPFTPGRPHTYRLVRNGEGVELIFNSVEPHAPSDTYVYVGPSPDRGDDGPVTGTTTATVLGKTATVTRMTDKVKVTWEERPGEWAVVGSRTLPEAEVVRYAQELRREPQPIPTPLTFAWLPADAAVELTSDEAMVEPVMVMPGGERGRHNDIVRVDHSGSEVGKVGDPLPVGDRTGYLSHRNGMTVLWVPLPGHGNISVSVPDSLGFTRDDLIRFTLGISNP